MNHYSEKKSRRLFVGNHLKKAEVLNAEGDLS